MTAFVTDICERCGNLRSVCSNPDAGPWFPQRSICYATAGAQQMYRRTESKYGHPDHDDGSPHATDGLEWWTSLHDLTPDDDFFPTQADLLAAARREQPIGEEGQSSEPKQEGAQ